MKRWLLIGLGVLVALLVLVDIGARYAAEAATAKALTSSLDLSSQPKVTIQGTPFLPHLVSGNFPSVTLDGEQVDSGTLTLKTLHAVLEDVNVPVMPLIQGHRVTITAASGSGTATVTAAEITRVLQNKGTGVTASALQSLGVTLPEAIPGVRYTAVRLVGDEAVLGFRLVNPSWAVGG
jgi:hypothetical protein